jgi:hypothetical protein
MAAAPNEVKSGTKSGAKYSDQEVQEALALLEQKRDRQKRIETGEIKGSYYKKVSEMSPEEREKRDQWGQRARVRAHLLALKAKEAKLAVSEAEVDAYLLKNPPRKKRA